MSPSVTVHFRKYANANSRIRLEGGCLTVLISDVLEEAPAPVHEALASILLSKLFRRTTSASAAARYRRYLNRADMRRKLELLKQERGRKLVLDPVGAHFNLHEVFEALNLKYFFGLMARPNLGWSVRRSRTTLGHYDPSHNTIVLSNLLDSRGASELIVNYVMFHEMLHLKYPTEHKAARRCVHTREFKRAEAKFEDFHRAKLELSRFLDREA
ncbi:MAG TPA: SprT-like domain-containing protein [Bryobacteraceae bacterium]|nr:SprT-like domain-containing protein [Bryobacteraceae bacterium]